MNKIISMCILCILLIITSYSTKKVHAQEFDEEKSHDLLLIEEEEKERRFNISGFLDFQYLNYKFKSKESNLKKIYYRNDTFSLNNFNLYFSFVVSDELLAFSEIRFLFTPTGIEQSTPIDSGGDVNSTSPQQVIITPYDNNASDGQGTRFKYGSIFIERAYFEWNRIPYANIRLGRFFTPFGIWSQDHGAPILTTVRVPILVSTPLTNFGMPQRQTGVELLGKASIPGTGIFLDYAAYIGNGISDSDSIQDEEDNNKAFGGFINFKLPIIASLFDIEFGLSGYIGERTLLCKKTATLFALTSTDGRTGLTYEPDPSDYQYYYKQMDTIAFAHVKVTISSLPFDGVCIIQSEGMRHWIDEDDEETRLVNIWGISRDPEDSTFYGYYIQMEYQFFGIITPYFRYEWIKSDTKEVTFVLPSDQGGKAKRYTIGLNYKPYEEVVIKAEWGRFDIITSGEWNKTDPNNPSNTTPYDANDDADIFSISVSFSF